MGGDLVQGQVVATRPLAGDGPGGRVVDEVRRAEGLPSPRVGQVDLPERQGDAGQRVAQRDGGVGQTGGVHDHGVEVPPVKAIDQGTLMIRLEEIDLDAELRGAGGDAGMDLVQRLGAVDVRLARPEQVEVGTLEDEDAAHADAPAADPASTDAATSRTTSSGTSSRTTTPSAVGRTQR